MESISLTSADIMHLQFYFRATATSDQIDTFKRKRSTGTFKEKHPITISVLCYKVNSELHSSDLPNKLSQNKNIVANVDVNMQKKLDIEQV